jgi:hypothetical protein
MHLHKVAEPWRQLLEKATEPDPGDRFASIDDMLASAGLGSPGGARGAGLSLPISKVGDLSCPNCRLANFPDSRFCRQCGGALRIPCPACGKEIHAGPKHCDQCGADTRLVAKLEADCAVAARLVDAADFAEAAELIEAIRKLEGSGNLGTSGARIAKQIEVVAVSCKDRNRSLRYVSSLGGMGLEFCGERNREASEIRHLATGMRLVEVPSGFFEMGSMHGDKDEQPVHRVHITRPFWICRTPVTQSQYKAVVGRNPSHFASGDDAPNRPVEMVSWNDAVEYCAAMSRANVMLEGVRYGFRLPTEAEWEYCCRAGALTEWSTGDSLSSAQANFGERLAMTTPVGRFGANAWGLSDMHGNVWEWCLDSKASYSGSATSDPLVSGGPDRVYRGGSWINTAASCRSAFRNSAGPAGAYSVVGFRVVLAPLHGT